MAGWVVLIFMVISVFVYYVQRHDSDDDTLEQEETSLKEDFLKGTSVSKKVTEENDGEKSLLKKVYSGKGPQPKYMRDMAAKERKRAIEAARIAAEEEQKDKRKI